jgi:hypothetical protein
MCALADEVNELQLGSLWALQRPRQLRHLLVQIPVLHVMRRVYSSRTTWSHESTTACAAPRTACSCRRCHRDVAACIGAHGGTAGCSGSGGVGCGVSSGGGCGGCRHDSHGVSGCCQRLVSRAGRALPLSARGNLLPLLRTLNTTTPTTASCVLCATCTMVDMSITAGKSGGKTTSRRR